MIGTTHSRYRIVAKLGEGGMGSVWRAEDPALGRTVALKLLSAALWADDTARQRFLREARAASQLEHPNIATVYDVGETDGLAWIAYQFVDGETVAARTVSGPLPVAEAVRLASETAEALAHAHARGVLHRDVTAGNIMVTHEGHAVLVDFGLALPERGAHLTTTGTALGTAGYMAPEVMRGEPANERSDLYGFGAVLYRMLTGRLPFEGGPPEAVMYRVLNERVAPPSELRPELPPALERVVLRLLERDPADRYASAAEVVEALREVAPERGPSVAERARRTVARRWRRAGNAFRRIGRARIGVAALATLALFAAAAWLAAREGWLPGMAAKPPTLAVLPFRDETDEPEATRYIADGLAEALTLDLSQTERMLVLPWVTSQRVKPDSIPLPRIARELNADRLLLGSMRSTANGLALSLAIVNGRDGKQTWARRFEGTTDRLPELESQMLFEAARAILGKLTPAERTRMALPAGRDGRAYDLYLEGSSLLRAGDPASLAAAEQFFQRSIDLDSTFADAHVGLGAIYNARYFIGAEGGIRLFQLAREQFEWAMRLDPSSPLAMRALVNTLWQQGRWEECLKLGMRAARTRPQTLDLRLVEAEAYTLGNLPEVGLRLSDEVLAQDPSNPTARFWAVIAASWSDQPGSALRHGAEYIRRFGEFYEVYVWMALASYALGKHDEALTFARRSLEIERGADNPRPQFFVAALEELTLGKASARPSWERLRKGLTDKLEQDPDQPRNRFLLLRALLALGDRSEALRQIQPFISEFKDPESRGIPDFDRLPYFLVKLGETDKAREAIAELERRGMFAEGVGSVNPILSLLDVSSDSLLVAYRARGRQHHDEMLSRYGNP